MDMVELAANVLGIPKAAPAGPTIYRDLPARQYHAMPELSASQIHTINSRGLAVYHHERTEPRASTEAMDFGTVCHSILFGNPDKELLIWSGADRRTKAGKDEHASKQDEAFESGRLLVKEIVYADATRVVEAVLHDPDVGAMLRAPGLREASIVWNDDEIATRCRMRADLIPEDQNLPIIDLKVCGNLPPSPRSFAYKVMAMGYDVQSYHYRSGVAAAGLGLRDFWFVFVEDHAPYEVAVVRLGEDWLARSSGIRKRVARELAIAQLDGAYPKRVQGVMDIQLPIMQEGGEE